MKKIKSLLPVLLLFINLYPALAEGPQVPGSTTASTTAVSGAPQVPAGQATAGSAAPQQPGPMGMMMPLLVMFAVLYFLMIRPQQKKVKEHQNLLSSIAHGDEIVTSSGILGKITGIADKVVTVEIADNVKVKLLKSQIAQVVKGQIKELA